MIARLLALATRIAEWRHGIGRDEQPCESCSTCAEIRNLRDARDTLAGDQGAILRRQLARLRVGRLHRDFFLRTRAARAAQA